MTMVIVNGSSAVCDQKTSKVFVSLLEESIARHMGLSLLKVREGKTKGNTGGIWKQRVCFSLQVFLKPAGREEPGDSHPTINEWGGAWVVPRPGKGGPWAGAWLI
jgi:hypothetical protein